MTAKIALITDIHGVRDASYKFGSQAPSILRSFKQFCTLKQPDLIVTEIPFTTQHLPGNHDVLSINIADCEAAFGSSLQSRSIDVGGFHLCFFCAEVDVKTSPGRYEMSSSDLVWLAADLAGTTLPTVVFTHVALNAGSLIGNSYFPASPIQAEYYNAAAARALISDSTTVLCMNGHIHWNNMAILDGVPYVTIQAACDATTTPGHIAARSYGLLTLDEKYISLEMNGYDPISYRFPTRPPRLKWA